FFLIDQYGTNAIVWFTGSALLVMGALVAAGQWAFRAAVVLGALQLVTILGLLASTTEDKMASMCKTIAGVRSGWSASEENFERDINLLDAAKKAKDQAAIDKITTRMAWRSGRADAEKEWADWGKRIGKKIHDLGRDFGLRSDNPLEYHDESNYYAINVSPTSQNGDIVKELKLDHLIHSYYNPEKPEELYYDYEKVYAALTERAAATWNRSTTAKLKAPLAEEFLATLPAQRVQYDAAKQQLTAAGAMEFGEFKALLSTGPYADYWKAMLKLWENSQSDPNGFISTPLESIPEGVSLTLTDAVSSKFRNKPSPRVHYDSTLKSVIAGGRLSLDDAVRLMEQGPNADYVNAVYDLYQKSRQVRTLFIGGGGFVFPRWVETKFPFEPLLDVAEIDPAVKLAVQLEMGLPDDEHTHVRTTIGDARKFVDDRRRANEKLKAAGKPPV